MGQGSNVAGSRLLLVESILAPGEEGQKSDRLQEIGTDFRTKHMRATKGGQ
jgi:hypothetical protein